MIRMIIMKNRDILTIPILSILLAALIALTPKEKELGSLIRLIYIHGAIATVGIILFLICAIIALVALAKPGKNLWSWTWSMKRIGMGFWVIYLLSSLLVAKLAWGGILWEEPRLRAGIYILISVIIIWAVSRLFTDYRAEPLANIVTGIGVAFLRIRAGLVFHPPSAVGTSDDLVLKSVFYGILFVTFFVGLEFCRLLVKTDFANGAWSAGPSDVIDE